jgi:ABC-type taurine transport system ATPase subunit
MRAMVLSAGLVVLAEGEAHAQRDTAAGPAAMAGVRLKLPQSEIFPFHALPDNASFDPGMRATAIHAAEPARNLTLSRLEIGLDNDGGRRHFAHIRLADTHVLGGDVSATFDGRAGTLRLTWPTGE